MTLTRTSISAKRKELPVNAPLAVIMVVDSGVSGSFTAVDAVLYVGPLAKITLERPQPWRCSEPAMAERLRRIRLQRPALADRSRTGVCALTQPQTSVNGRAVSEV